MKGFSGFKPSPAKVSDETVVNAQKRLDKIETSYRAPGWAKAAGAIHGNLLTGGMAKKSGRGDVAEDIDDRPAAGSGGTASGGGGGGEKTVGDSMKDIQSTVQSAKGLAGEIKGLGGAFGDIFKGAKKTSNGGGGGSVQGPQNWDTSASTDVTKGPLPGLGGGL